MSRAPVGVLDQDDDASLLHTTIPRIDATWSWRDALIDAFKRAPERCRARLTDTHHVLGHEELCAEPVGFAFFASSAVVSDGSEVDAGAAVCP